MLVYDGNCRFRPFTISLVNTNQKDCFFSHRRHENEDEERLRRSYKCIGNQFLGLLAANYTRTLPRLLIVPWGVVAHSFVLASKLSSWKETYFGATVHAHFT